MLAMANILLNVVRSHLKLYSSIIRTQWNISVYRKKPKHTSNHSEDFPLKLGKLRTQTPTLRKCLAYRRNMNLSENVEILCACVAACVQLPHTEKVFSPKVGLIPRFSLSKVPHSFSSFFHCSMETFVAGSPSCFLNLTFTQK